MARARRSVVAVAVGLVVLAGVGVSLMSAQQPAPPVNDKPLTEKWAPTEWGANDKVGAPNRTTPAMVLKAMRLVKQGKVATLGKLYQSSIPAFGARSWTMSIPGTPTGGPFGKNALIYHDELVTTEIGQIGTQFDGPGHIGVRTSKGDFMYNGRWREQAYERGGGGRVVGMGDLGVEFVAEKGFVCRGVLLDAPAYRGVKRLPIPKDSKSPGIVTAADVRAMVQKQGLAEISEGDCVFLYTGHGDLWLNADWKGLSPEEKAKRRAEFTSGEPGFGASACEYMAQRKIILTGGDTSANDAQPAGEQGEEFAVPCHTEMQTKRGIWNIENLEFTQLLKDKVYEFAFVWAPLKIVGGTGSPGNPVALY
jgi:kynurenine formamidase